jgi:predicted transposase/invertase (TIGR01784 family)
MAKNFLYQEEEEHDRLSEATEIIFYELPKLENRLKDCLANGAEIKNLQKDEKWCIYMKYRHEPRAGELIEELCRKEAGIMRAEKVVSKISRDEKRYARYVAEMKNNIDLMFAEERGRKEGIQEIARKMKKMGDSIEKIQAITELPAETIERM